MSLARWFDRVADGVSERPLALFEGESVSYGEIRARAWRIGSGLQRLRVVGERVVTMLPNDPELLAIQLGILHAGGIAVPIMAEGTREEMRHFIDDARPAVIVATRERWRAVADLVRAEPRVVILTDVAGAAGPGRIEELATLERAGEKLGLDPLSVRETDPMALMYTSGSTARPRGVIVDAASFIRDAESQPELFGFRDGDNVLGVLQLYHMAGWHQSLAIALGCRGGLMMQARFSASRFWEDVDRAPAVGGLLMPAMVAILLTRPERDDDADHPLRVVLSHWRNEAFERRFDVEIIPVWGQTELGGLAASGRKGEELPAANCVGWPVRGTEIEIRDEHGKVLRPGEAGEVYVRSPWVMKGYWGDSDLTTSTLRGGWVRTGDAGKLDAEGRLYYAGRLKAMIKRAGENISAFEVESVLASHPDVAECVCFAVPDPIRTEEVKVVMVPRQGAAPAFSELIEFCRERLAEFKVPRYWERRVELPRTRSMKVAIAELQRAPATEHGWDRMLEQEPPAR